MKDLPSIIINNIKYEIYYRSSMCNRIPPYTSEHFKRFDYANSKHKEGSRLHNKKTKDGDLLYLVEVI